MAKAVAIVITGIAIALLVIYGADVAAGTDNPDKEGFLAMDHKARGYGPWWSCDGFTVNCVFYFTK